MLGRAHRTAAAVLGDPGSGQKPVRTATRVSRPHVFLAAQVIALIAMLLADLAYSLLNPRIRYSRAE